MTTKNPPMVYLVDDEQDALEVFEEVLAEHFQVLTFHKPEEALKAIQSDPPDCLVSDLVMPQMNGVQFVSMIRKDNSELPIIIISGHGEKQQIIELFRLGCFDFITKPFTYGDLVSKIQSVLKEKSELSDKLDLGVAKNLIHIEESGAALKVQFHEHALDTEKYLPLIRHQLMKVHSAVSSSIVFNFSEVDQVTTEALVLLRSYFDRMEQDGRQFHWTNISQELNTLLSCRLLNHKSA